ncbi:centromere protein J-like [Pipra filicauda]|uniref:Centromere protein J-like n=1 Tax=Pipra filicauda TaxID=649802 RepID=A0A7R5KGE9_9PASS|nr:centromere protein J-like [Pipra filicauda]
MDNSNVSTDNLGHNQAFQHTRQLYYSTSSDFFSQKLNSSVIQAGIHDANDTSEMFTPPLLPASEPGMNHCAPTYKTMEQTPGQQDQLMKKQMEQLQRLVAEQQKIIALYNPGISTEPLLQSTESPTKNLSRQDAQEENRKEKKDSSQLKEGFSEAFSAAKEEQREQLKEEISPSLFVIEGKIKTGSIEDRPVTSAIGIRQKTSEKFVEEQLKADNHLTEKQHKEQQSKAKITSLKVSLKRREVMARFKKIKQKTVKEDSKHSRRAGLNHWGNFFQSGQVNTGILQPGECPQLNLQVSNSVRMDTHEKKADCALAEWEIKTDCEAKVAEQSAEEKQVIGRDEDSKKNPVDSSQRRWPEILQPCPETITGMNLQVVEERETHHMDSLGQAGRTDGRPLESTLTKDLGRVDQSVKGHLIDGAKTPLEFLQRHYPLQDLETDCIKEAECSGGPAFTWGQKWVQVCPQELVLGSQNSESERQIHTGFKMVNDKIIKITCNPPEAAEKGGSSSALQQKWQRKRTVASTCQVASLSCESNCSSRNSDDNPKSHHVQHPSQHVTQRVDHTDRHLDLSDGHYASDESSGTEKMSAKMYSRSPPRKQGLQAISGQQDLSCSTSSSDSSTGTVCLKGSKARSSLQESLFHRTRLKRREHKPESKNENRDSGVKNLHLPSSRVAHEIPIFKIKEIPEVEELQKKLFTDTLEETQNILSRGLETGNNSGTPSLTVVNENDEKTMHFHRTRIDQPKTVRSQELTHTLEHNRDQTHPLQKEKIAQSKFRRTARVTEENVKSEEIQVLKQQIAGLQEEFKRSESCWRAAYSKLRDQVELLTRQNMELRDELRISEHQRWKAEKNPKAVNFLDRKSETPATDSSVQRAHPLRSVTKEHQEKKPSNCSIDRSTPTGRRTLNQGKLTPLEPEKVVHQPSSTGGKTDSRKSPGAVSHVTGLFKDFKEPNSSSCIKGMPLPISDSSEDMSLSHNHSNDTCSFVPCNNNEEREPPKLSGRSMLNQERRKSEEEVQEKIEYCDGKVEEVLTDGRRILTFRNGTKKEISVDKRTTTISFSNGDVKKIMPDQRVIYYYADAQTTHTAYPDGLKVLQFPNNQIEKHYPDGTQEIVFPDHTVKCLYSDGLKETFFPDGTVVKVEKNGDKIVIFSNGQKEIHTAQFKRREYPDGTVKTVYCNGRRETKYSTGRVQIKDEEGNLILDKK